MNQRRIDSEKFLDDWEIADVATWLCGHKEYKWLYIDQEDKKHIGYRCIISDLKITKFGSVPWAMTAHVTCDSPYAYLETEEITCDVSGSETIEVYNPSSLNDWYYPVVLFDRTSGTAFSVTNEQDDDKGPSFTDIPGSVTQISIDNDSCVIDNDQDLNLYSYFNFEFLRLKRGYNNLTITGNGTVTIRCEYPINVGG